MTGEAVRTTGPTTSIDPNRESSSSSRIRPSSRARTAPMQKWGPNPNATCGFGSLAESNRSAVGPNTDSSRLAEAYSISTGSPGPSSRTRLARSAGSWCA